MSNKLVKLFFVFAHVLRCLPFASALVLTYVSHNAIDGMNIIDSANGVINAYSDENLLPYWLSVYALLCGPALSVFFVVMVANLKEKPTRLQNIFMFLLVIDIVLVAFWFYSVPAFLQLLIVGVNMLMSRYIIRIKVGLNT